MQPTVNRPDDSLRRLGGVIAQRVAPAAIGPGEWAAVVSLAEQQRVAPVLYWRLNQAGAQLPEGLWQRLRKSTIRTATAYLLLEMGQQQIQKALADIGVACVWLKGSALAPTVYANPSLRPMGDLDFLVPYGRREAALAAVQALQYRRPPDGLLSDASHHYHLVGGRGDLIHVELHYALLGKKRSELLPAAALDWFWRQTEAVEYAPGKRFLTFRPEAHLLYLCAHALLQHGEAEMDLLHFLDLHLLIGKREIDWDLVGAKAVELRWAYAVERALRKSVAFFGTPIPESLFLRLAQRTPADFVQRVRLLQGTGTDFEKVWHFLRTMPLPEAAHYFCRILWPSGAYMRRRYQVPEERPLWPYYLLRWRRQGQKTMAALGYRLRLLVGRYLRPRRVEEE